MCKKNRNKILFLLFFIFLVSCVSISYVKAGVPIVKLGVPNISRINSNSSNYWDNLDTPIDISILDLSDWLYQLNKNRTSGITYFSSLLVGNEVNATRFNGTYYGDGSNLIISTVHNASSIETEAGTLDSGNLASILSAEDGDSYNVSEDTGANPLIININFTNVNDFDSIIGRIYYDGGKGHIIQLEVLRTDTGAWENYLDLTDTTDFVNIYVPVFDPVNHITSDGNVTIRFNHVQNGVPTHNLFIDYLAIVEGFTTLTTFEHDSLSGRDNESNHPFIYAEALNKYNSTYDNYALNVSINYTLQTFNTYNPLWYSYNSTAELETWINANRSGGAVAFEEIQIRGAAATSSNKLEFWDDNGLEWYINYISGGVNFAEERVADRRLFLYDGGGAYVSKNLSVSNKVNATQMCINCDNVKGAFQIGPNVASQEISGLGIPHVLFQGVDNEVSTLAFQIKDENLHDIFNVTTVGGETAGKVSIRGDVTIGESLGIGIASALNPLHIKDNSPYILLEETDQTNKQWQLRGYQTNFDITEGGVGPHLTVKAGGNVGIGTANPTHNFNNYGTTNLSGNTRIEGDLDVKTTGDGGIALSSDGNLLLNVTRYSAGAPLSTRITVPVVMYLFSGATQVAALTTTRFVHSANSRQNTNTYSYFGTSDQSGIKYNGSDPIFDPDISGSGSVWIGATGDDNLYVNDITASGKICDSVGCITAGGGDNESWNKSYADTLYEPIISFEEHTVYKIADETLNNDGTVQNDDHLFFSVDANTNYTFKFHIFTISTTTADFEFSLVTPANPNNLTFIIGDLNRQHYLYHNTGGGAGQNIGWVTGAQVYQVWGTLENGANSGTVNLKWAQGTATAVDTTVYRGSYLEYRKFDGAFS